MRLRPLSWPLSRLTVDRNSKIRGITALAVIIFYLVLIVNPFLQEAQAQRSRASQDPIEALEQHEEGQAVINERYERRLQSLEEKVRQLESSKPELMNQNIKVLSDEVQQNESLLWGIAVAVIINLLTGGNKMPFRLSRRKESDDSSS